jgi:hypothetical protein
MVQKNWPEEESEQLAYGNRVHEAMAAALRGTPLPTEHQIYQPWIDRINRSPGELLTECKWGLTADFKPTPWMSSKVWLRTIADVVKLNPDAALVMDWKTGKSQNADPIQLILTSLVMFCYFPQIEKVQSDFIWLQEDDRTTQVLYREEVADAWADILPRVKRLEQATLDNEFPPKPGRFCRSWCPVKSCEYWGK